MGTKTFAVFERVSQDCISESVYKWQVEWVFSGYRRTGAGTLWKDCRADETGARYHRTAKGEKHRRMDRENEQYTSVCEGDCG